MELYEFNNKLDEELGSLNENILSGAKKKVSEIMNNLKVKVKQQTLRNVANAFFKKNPELLEAVKQRLGVSQQASESLYEAKGFQKGMLMVAIILALASGIVKPANASEPINFKDIQSNTEVTNYITTMKDAVETLETEDFTEKLVGSFVVGPQGNYVYVQNSKIAQRMLKASQNNLDKVVILSNEEIEGTGKVSKSQRTSGSNLNRKIMTGRAGKTGKVNTNVPEF